MNKSYLTAPTLPEKVQAAVIAIAPILVMIISFYYFDYISMVAALLVGTLSSVTIYILSSLSLEREFYVKQQLSITQSDLQSSHHALDQRAEMIEKMIDGLPDPLIFINKKHRCLRRNATARDYFPNLSPGRPITSVLRHPELIYGIDYVLDTGEARSVAIELPSNVATKMEVRILPIATIGEDGNNEHSAILLAMQDVTKVERSEAMRADFVANVSHELRTPLTSLVGFAETLLGPAKDDEEARLQFLGIMQEQAERMLQIIEDLLSLSRIEVDEHSRPTEEVDIRDALRKTCDTLKMKADKNQTTLDLKIAEDIPLIQGDEGQLIQVFQNLIDNAIKYGSENGAKKNSVVTVTVQNVDEAHISVAIADQGKGIPEDSLPRLTERFYRVDTARSREMGGTGLGLAIVKHIVNRHRGKLYITSEVDKGSCFSISLPIRSSIIS
ncbi:ATP-binding protein [Curvivirga aplysinae]|uniref:ATP-binding protein n=1 Tax=Curvivirga aplysinae TaxID=2529852 RepID=UPI0012BCAB64|nr:ATP-binding protein [Curvivirga aplysinae]MTI10295.1 GHKL domain-containing protein [Curvivirga aplysinae]